jgi:ADP-ribose pyrophosphatase
VDYFSWEFPAGHMEHGSIEDAARAELEEETGLVATKIEKIGEFHIAPGHNTQIIVFYLATSFKTGTRHLEPAEKGIQLKIVRTFAPLAQITSI